MEEENNLDTNENIPKIPKKTRGQTTCIQADKRAAQKAAKKAAMQNPNDDDIVVDEDPLHIEFDEYDNPIGPSKVDFVTELGKLGRNIRIIHKTWGDVPDGQKNTIWLDLKEKWNIEDDTKERKVMQRVSNSFRQFKCMITCNFVYKNRKQKREVQLEFPFELYPQVSREDYKEFVQQRMDPKFQAVSEKARNSQKQNIHRHHLGRAGYEGKIEQWRKELIDQETLNDPDADPKVIRQIIEIRLKDRCFKWIRAHTPPSKNPPPKTKELIEEMNNWLEKQKNGEFTATRMEDVFVKATGKREHPGRTRGVGGIVRNQEYFGKPEKRGKGSRGKVYSEEQLIAFEEEVKEKVTRQSIENVQVLILEMAKAMGLELPPDFNFNGTASKHTSLNQEAYSSYHSAEPDDPFIELERSVPCWLAVLDYGNLITVAEGMVRRWEPDSEVHNAPLTSDMVHVTIDNVLESTALLPVPFYGFTTVGEVQGSFAQWPKKWVFLEKDEDMLERNHKISKGKVTDDSFNKNNHKDSVGSLHNEMDHDGKAKKKSKTNGQSKSKHKSTTTQTKKDQDKEKSTEVDNVNHKLTQKDQEKNKSTKIDNVNDVADKSKIDQEDNGPLTGEELICLSEHSMDLEHLLCALSSQSVSVVNITIDASVYNFMNNRNNPIIVSLIFGDIRQMFKYDWLNITMMQTWGRFLHDYEKLLGDKSNVGYMCPTILSSYTSEPLEMRKYVTHVLKIHQGKKYVMGAFFQVNHWMLIVFCPNDNLAYIFDSAAANKRTYEIIEHLKSAWRVYTYLGGSSPTTSKEFAVKRIKCPQQPGSFECGYYVMKWMYDITFTYSTSEVGLEMCVYDSTMTIDDMDKVREFWSQNCMKNMRCAN